MENKYQDLEEQELNYCPIYIPVTFPYSYPFPYPFYIRTPPPPFPPPPILPHIYSKRELAERKAILASSNGDSLMLLAQVADKYCAKINC